MTQTQLPSCIVHAFRQLKIPTEGLVQASPEKITDTTQGLSYFVKTTSSLDVVTRFRESILFIFVSCVPIDCDSSPGTHLIQVDDGSGN
ncbi:hypothetical protein PGT21_032362 [Puccinia graminis f. sp. tritici]|uniref:Uncharacterized protein n=1 Tax=Puccinia graminis f. sp. tritici TaxID=56615 RepID=A0A5B0Q0H8_PUCGR|nr:hypothetical protein PGT21_032362 [Puccinia graminis f. sp. tritici]KAA1106702.1 hypothetical protein PGTUg99_009846 [Puccinia graminis f. sp. tritici]